MLSPWDDFAQLEADSNPVVCAGVPDFARVDAPARDESLIEVLAGGGERLPGLSGRGKVAERPLAFVEVSAFSKTIRRASRVIG
jgi:hypothetical protein